MYPSIHIHLCFLLSVSRENWEYRTQYTCTSMFSSICFQRILRIQKPVYIYIYVFFLYTYTGFCILSILWKQKEENIDVHVYWVLYSQFSLETERRQHSCTCILYSQFSLETERRKHRCTCITEPSIRVHLCFLSSVSNNTENTEPSIHVHLCFLLSVSRENWEYRTQYTCTSMFSCILGSVFSVFSGNRKKKT
jgi:hypothetical protein